MVMRSRRVTWRGMMVGGRNGTPGVGKGAGPEERVRGGASGSSSMAGILISGAVGSLSVVDCF